MQSREAEEGDDYDELDKNVCEHNDSDVLYQSDFDQQIEHLRGKGKPKYDLLVKAGAVFNIMKRIWDTEDIPRTWDLTTLLQL